MKQLSLEKMEEIDGGIESCGVGIGILAATAWTGVGLIWGIAAAMALCLNGDQ